MKKYTPYIIQYDNVIEDSKIDEYLKIFSKNFKDKEPDIAHLKNRQNNAYIISKYKKVNEELAYADKSLNEEIAFPILFQYYKDCPLINTYWQPINTVASVMSYRWYDTGDSYNWHVDFEHTMRFMVSFLLYLNDDFEGGETMFLNDRLKIKPKKGSVLMFPCGPYFIHKSTPIRSGAKHVVWNCFRDYYTPLKT